MSKEARRKVKLQKVGSWSWRRKKPPVDLSGTSPKTSILTRRFISLAAHCTYCTILEVVDWGKVNNLEPKIPHRVAALLCEF